MKWNKQKKKPQNKKIIKIYKFRKSGLLKKMIMKKNTYINKIKFLQNFSLHSGKDALIS